MKELNDVSEKWKQFWKDERALGTLEILLIVAVLVALALVFRKYILSWFQTLMNEADQAIRGTKSDMNSLKQMKPSK
jgi:hypothetical protein